METKMFDFLLWSEHSTPWKPKDFDYEVKIAG